MKWQLSKFPDVFEALVERAASLYDAFLGVFLATHGSS